MSKLPQLRIDAAAANLLLQILEGPEPVLAAGIPNHSPAARYLVKHELLKPDGYEPAFGVLDDDSDGPVLLTWSSETEEFGYFNESSGWMRVPHEQLLSFRVEFAVLIRFLQIQLRMPVRPAVTLMPDHLWELGSIGLSFRARQTQVLFARRLSDAIAQRGMASALRNRPSSGRRVLLTSTPANLLPESTGSYLIVSLFEFVQPDRGLDINRSAVAARYQRISPTYPADPIVIIAGGKEVQFYGKAFRFLKGVKQRQVIEILYKNYLEGRRSVSSEEIAIEVGLGDGSRIRDLFRKNEAWGQLLTERGGMCEFCLPDRK